MNARQRGSAIAAVWLIGLGAVFLVRQATGLDWGQAWPLFVILLGVVGLITQLASDRIDLLDPWSWTWSVLWIAAGVVLLMGTTGGLGQDPGDLFAQTWPWLVIALGVWYLIGAFVPRRGRPIETLAVPLGGATAGSVQIKFGAGELSLGEAEPGHLVDGRFDGGVVRRERGPGQVELEQDTSYGLPWLDHPSNWTVGVAADIPLNLRVDTGAARSVLDLSDLQVRSMELHTGASETSIRVPRSAGATSIKAETGAASLLVEIPTGVAARIRSKMALGSSHVDEGRFPRTASGFESPDYAVAANRVDLDLQGGVGSIRVVGIA